MEAESEKEILARRKEIEKGLSDMLKETGSDFTLKDIKDVIYNEEGQDDLTKIIAMFDRGGDTAEIENILEVAGDAWNYFPHKIIGVISPAEAILKYRKNS
ncbi:MAG TPA: hypothetical protein VIJ29_01795 [Candidatus Paceibacterota bacterium]